MGQERLAPVEWVEILAFTIFAYLTPIYGTFAWIANRLLRQTQARHLSFAATDLYGALLFMSIGVGYSLLTLFQEQTVFPPLLGLFLFYMLIYAVLGAFAGAVVISTIAKSLGYPKR